jgi:uncharacterized protein (TIGR03086 family)
MEMLAMIEYAAWPALLTRTYDLVRQPVALLDAPLLDRRSPCAEWTVGDLFDHVVEAITMFATAAGAPAEESAAPLSPAARFDAAVARNLAAWRTLADPTATLTLPFGRFPAEQAVAMNQLDTLVHGWDLAVALGMALPIPDDLATAALATAEIRCRREPRSPARGPELPPRDDSLVERLLALTGRDTAAWPGAVWVAGSLVTVRPTIGDPQVASGVSIWEREGAGPPRHVHAEHDEIWYVLEGRFTFAVGEREFAVGPGQFVVGPRGVPHTFRADTAHSQLLDIHLPGGFERFFVQAGRPAAALVPPPEGGDDPAALRASIEDFGASVVGPPLRGSVA